MELLKDNFRQRLLVALGLSMSVNTVFLAAVLHYSLAHPTPLTPTAGYVAVVFQDRPEPPVSPTPAPAPTPVAPLPPAQPIAPTPALTRPATLPPPPLHQRVPLPAQSKPVLTAVTNDTSPAPQERPQPSVDSLPTPAPRATTPSATPVAPVPTPTPTPTPKPTPAPTPTPKPTPTPTPKPTPTPTPLPTPTPTPKPSGPTREAEPSQQVQPSIPEALRKGEFKSFVRVVVEIDADGSFEATLRTSSGNPEIDKRVLEALKKWKWKPALKNGQPVASSQRFKFEFEVQ